MQIISRGAEAKLVETLAELRDRSDSWTVVIFHLHMLSEQYRSDYQTKIAVNLVFDLLNGYAGNIFVFSDGAIGVLCNNMNTVLANKLIFQLRYLCMDDPLAYTEDGHENNDFCTVFKLATEWQKCLNFATRRMTFAGRVEDEKAVREKEDPAGAKKHHFSAMRLAGIERDLSEMDLDPAIRRQPVCAVTGSGNIRKVFDELYIHMQHLRSMLKVDVDFFSNKWLFKYLTQLLDKRVIALLKANHDKYLSQPVSININVEALLADWFTEFDTSLQASHKVAIVFEVPVVDVFADMAAFNIARDQVQKLGYRICIDGLTTQSFLHVDRERLKADLMKLQWNADVTGDLSQPENKMLQKAVQACGASRVILCRCDGKPAVEYGQALGLSLFQGRYLDGLINPKSAITN